jgi:ABC-type branched-subunit amino acid transport system substrate-binding protein
MGSCRRSLRESNNGRPARARVVFQVSAALAVAALAAAGCSSGSSSSTAAAASGTPASTSAASTYSIGLIADLSGNGGVDLPFEQAIVGSVDAANAREPIHGHAFKLIVCDSQTNDNADAACGQEMVSDHVVAVYDLAGETAALPYLQSAGIPDLNYGAEPQDWTSPVSFATNTLGLTSTVGFIALAKAQGCQSIAAVSTIAGTPAAAAAQQAALSGAAKAAGIAFKDYIDVPATAPDLAPYVAQAVAKGIDCIALEGLGAQEVSMLNAMVTEPSNIKVITGISFLSAPGEAASLEPIAAKLGSRLVVLTATENVADPPNSLVKQWVSDQDGYGGKSPDLGSSVAQTLWAEQQLLTKVANAVYPDVTASSILKALDQVSDFWPGVSPPVSFDKPVPNAFGPRVFAVWIAPTKYVNGVSFPRTGPFINLLTGATSENTQAG